MCYFRLLRLEFNQSHLEYYTELDAVLLTGSKLPLNSQNVDVKEEKSISTIGNGNKKIVYTVNSLFVLLF